MSDARSPDALQPERTALAWRRTALSVAVGSLVAMRVLDTAIGPAGTLLGLVGLLWSLDLALTGRRRYAAGRLALALDPARRHTAPVAGPDVVRALAAALTLGVGSLVTVLVVALH